MAEAVYALQAELHEVSADDRVLAVGRDLAKADRLVERERFFHRRQGVQAHAGVADRPGFADDRLGEPPSEARTPRGRSDVQALHLADAVAEGSECHAAG